MLIQAGADLKSPLKEFEESPVRNQNFCFPPRGLGKVELARTKVVNTAMSDIESQIQRGYGMSSLYFYGLRASGKSVVLVLLAKRLKQEGYIVYYFSNGDLLEQTEVLDAIPDYLEKKVAVVVDEVPSASGKLVSLLQSQNPNLVVVGAGVPQFDSSGFTVYFKTKMSLELRLQAGDEDMSELIKYWKGLKVAEDAVVEDICNFLCSYCGGHFFPTARLMEHAFTDSAAKPYLKSIFEFEKYFFSEEFNNSFAYKDVLDRCFSETLESRTSAMLSRVLAGKGSSADISTMRRLGWWSDQKREVISTLLCNVLLTRVQPDQPTQQIVLQQVDDPQENLETIIVAGLYKMHPSDFTCIWDPSTHKVENGIAFSWGHCVKMEIHNAFIQFQARGIKGLVDYFFNHTTNGVIEAVLNGDLSKGGSQSILQHGERFRHDKYPWKTWALLNFDMKGPRQLKAKRKMKKQNEASNSIVLKPIVLPNECKKTAEECEMCAGKCNNFTSQQLARTYTFVHADNVLYQGTQIIKAPAVRSLPCAFHHRYVPLKERKLFSVQNQKFSTSASAWLRAVGFGRRQLM
jgi:hypothetical protein